MKSNTQEYGAHPVGGEPAEAFPLLPKVVWLIAGGAFLGGALITWWVLR
jgi:hypothetical protein